MTPPPAKRGKTFKTAAEATAWLNKQLEKAMCDPVLSVVNAISFADTQAEAAAVLKDNRHVFAQLAPERRQQWLREIDELIDAKPVLDEYED
jgi:hypothetical protein